ncbi:CLUMA_CG001610, isoform A [Clunio marinus]|uniref:CLUMA_CG001610, isoform A n=1 Tax=Clunio marinus TaxID=568069 RepID=A0A1J1HMX8_9DIPT|nr:CLUMA_CG001610, isoform A [Clunio marinus]
MPLQIALESIKLGIVMTFFQPKALEALKPSEWELQVETMLKHLLDTLHTKMIVLVVAVISSTL